MKGSTGRRKGLCGYQMNHSGLCTIKYPYTFLRLAHGVSW